MISYNNERLSKLLTKLNIELRKNDKLLVSSRAINNAKRDSSAPSFDDYRMFYSNSMVNLKIAVTNYIYSQYPLKTKLTLCIPRWFKAKIKK